MELVQRKPTFKGSADWFTGDVYVDPIAQGQGDVIVTPPDEWHWHGAAPNHFMAHLAFTEGETVWGDHLTADEYPSEQ